mmetsp:Transcript_40901/g.63849  ORF Transcript_40901/g.63849 Transcript_40901/m.63849 type:complete len:813 (+) Transcript_40901:368-2806(+)|eukprot:CAMPEP_0184303878 /NCGR_PEP_ID=MMETSP1049-20130417/13534_1 /TAXON_ID=77928 /ORGANISM="Proteomonas sulcata, Strain CCMP704" /LENGTH=812 /DNA_ID=CAMNT_0026615557 /DNA_START=113 /DNA_END=2551 /DNA_ORIENTATION=-
MVLEIRTRPEWAVVTGGNGGLGKQVAEKMARAGFNVLLGCRSRVVGERTATSIQAALPRGSSVRITYEELDLGEGSSIRQFVEKIRTGLLGVKVLVNAAGVFAPLAGARTRSGLDFAFAVNYLGVFHLTQLLLPILERNSPAKVINITCNEFTKCKQMDLPFIHNQAGLLDTDGLLRLTIDFAKGLQSTNAAGTSNPFVRAEITGQKYETKVKSKTLNPVWNESHNFYVENSSAVLHLEVLSREKTVERPLGKAEISLFALQGSLESRDKSLATTLALKGTEQKETTTDAVASRLKVLRETLLTGDAKDLLRDFNIVDLSMTDDKIMRRAQGAVSFKEEAADVAGVTVNTKTETVGFLVMKRLNMFKTSKRNLVIDISKKQLRNETIHGRIRKSFPFDQILAVVLDHDNTSKLALTFSMFDTLDTEGNLIAAGGQRDYELTFNTNQQRNLFVRVLTPFLAATAKHMHGMIAFTVVKRLNAFQQGLRKLVVDLQGRRLLNLESDNLNDINGLTITSAVVNKFFDFAQIQRLRDDPAKPNDLTIEFQGGQRAYQIEFLTEDQKGQWLKIMEFFLPKETHGSIGIHLFYSPPAGGSNLFDHKFDARAFGRKPDGDLKPWTVQKHIRIPAIPEWSQRDWDRSKAMITNDPKGAQVSAKNPEIAVSHAKFCLVAMSMELAKKLQARGNFVTCHCLDPGMMDTGLFRKAVGLSKVSRNWHNWKARNFGNEPSDVAKCLEWVVADPIFEVQNGLYVKYNDAGPRITNYNKTTGQKDEQAKFPPAACFDKPSLSQLWYYSVQMTQTDFEDPSYAAFLALR